jgi:hypothetical protein
MANSKVKNTAFSLLFCKTFLWRTFAAFPRILISDTRLNSFQKFSALSGGSSEAGHVQNGSKWKKPLINMF